jgi:hypothetical protein
MTDFIDSTTADVDTSARAAQAAFVSFGHSEAAVRALPKSVVDLGFSFVQRSSA